MTTKPLDLAQRENAERRFHAAHRALLAECKRQREQIKTLREALRWYVTCKGTPDFDGEIGRAALAAADKECDK